MEVLVKSSKEGSKVFGFQVMLKKSNPFLKLGIGKRLDHNLYLGI